MNRLSLGVQALNDSDLRFLGRRHSAAEALEAIGLARRLFPRHSFDLIYARPGQAVESWKAELRQALGMAGDHLSLYQLTIEAETPFGAAFRRGCGGFQHVRRLRMEFAASPVREAGVRDLPKERVAKP